MKHHLYFYCFLCLILSLFVYGCGQKKAASSKEAIEKSKTMATLEEKVDYLTEQAEAFYESKEYKEAMDTAQYVIDNLKADAQKAKRILEESQTKFKSVAEKMVADLKEKVNNTIKDFRK